MSSNFFSHYLPTPRYLKFSYVGFEIGQDGFRYSQLLHETRGPKIGKYGLRKLNIGNDIFSSDELKSALKEISSKEHIEYVKSTLPEEKTYLFTIDITGNTNDEIRNQIEFQLEENVPLSGAEALFEFYILPHAPGAKRQAVVSVVGVDTVLEYTEFFKSVGMTPVSFMAESGSVSRAIVPAGDRGTYLMVYFFDNKTVCSIVSKGYVQFTSTVSTGVGLMTSAIEKYYKLEKSEAEKLKIKEGIQFGDGKIEQFSVMANAISVIQDEIQKVLIYWHTHRVNEGQEDVSKVIICGKDAGLEGLSEYLAMTLKRKVEVANVWINMPRYQNEVPPIQYEDSLIFAGSLGLSL